MEMSDKIKWRLYNLKKGEIVTKIEVLNQQLKNINSTITPLWQSNPEFLNVAADEKDDEDKKTIKKKKEKPKDKELPLEETK